MTLLISGVSDLLLEYNVLIAIPLFRQTTAFLVFFIGLFLFESFFGNIN